MARATWRLARHRRNRRILLAAYLRRHAGLVPPSEPEVAPSYEPEVAPPSEPNTAPLSKHEQGA
jgi:hypothetical protein